MNIDRLNEVFDDYMANHPNPQYKNDEFARFLDDKFNIYLIPAGESFTTDLAFVENDENGRFKLITIESDIYFNGKTVEIFNGKNRDYIYISGYDH